MAVLNFLAKGTSRSHAEITGNYLEMELIKSKKIVLLEREQVKGNYRLNELNQYTCKDSSCAVFAGKLLEANYVVFGDIEKKRSLVITAKVICVSSESIILTCSETFSSMNNARKPIKRIAEKIIAAILNPQKSEISNSQVSPSDTNTTKHFKRHKPEISIHIRPLVFLPLEKLDDLVDTGTGFTCGLMFSRIFSRGPNAAQNLTVGFDTGFLYAPGNINKDDSFMMVPFLLSLGYRVRLFEKVYCTPIVSGGISYLRFYHTNGDGFDMEENSSNESVEGLLKFTTLFGRPVAKNLHLQALLSFWLITETPRLPYFLTVNIGIQYCFNN